ncbi:MAG: hypothetical protein ABIH00_04320 [Armatimonadota bacterium]
MAPRAIDKKNKTGFSLLELIVSLMIMVTVVFSVAALFVLSTKTIKQSSDVATLTFLAQLKAEELKSKRFSFLPAETDPALAGGVHEGNFGQELNDADFSLYNYKAEIEDSMKDSSNKTTLLKKAVITAYGPGKSGNAGTPRVSLTVFIRCYDTRNNIVIGPQPFPLQRRAATVYTDKVEIVNGRPVARNWSEEEKTLAKFYPVEIFDKTKRNFNNLLTNSPQI